MRTCGMWCAGMYWNWRRPKVGDHQRLGESDQEIRRRLQAVGKSYCRLRMPSRGAAEEQESAAELQARPWKTALFAWSTSHFQDPQQVPSPPPPAPPRPSAPSRLDRRGPPYIRT